MTPRLSTTAGAVLVLGLLGAVPAVGVALSSGPGGQPPPGAPAHHIHVDQPGSEAQPPPGAPARHIEVDQPGAEAQPANAHPVKAGPPVGAPNDEPGARAHRHQVDEGTAVSGPDQGD
ncbi:hypothetical protein [Marmoricola sp. URHA0025 HA25]